MLYICSSLNGGTPRKEDDDGIDASYRNDVAEVTSTLQASADSEPVEGGGVLSRSSFPAGRWRP